MTGSGALGDVRLDPVHPEETGALHPGRPEHVTHHVLAVGHARRTLHHQAEQHVGAVAVAGALARPELGLVVRTLAGSRRSRRSSSVTRRRRGIYSYPPVASPDGGAHATAGGLTSFHRALREGRLLGPESTAAILEPKEDYKAMPGGMHCTGFGFEFEVDPGGDVVNWWKEGINVGVSGVLSHWPRTDVTFALLSNRQEGAWG